MTDAHDGDGRTHFERMVAGDLYLAYADEEIATRQRRARALQDRFNRTDADDDGGRRAILAELLMGFAVAHAHPPA